MEEFTGSATSPISTDIGSVPVIPQATVEEVPEFLMLDHECEISYDHKLTPPQLRGGTLTGLVEQLTRHDRLDPAFDNIFLLTYKTFTTASELFEMLVKRWSIQPPYRLAKEDYRTWVDRKKKPIRFRVVNILKSWLDNYWIEGNDDDTRILIQRVYNFVKGRVATTSTPGAAPLMILVEQRSRGSDMPTKRLTLTLNTQMPQPILPKRMKKLKFLNIDPTELARQLTIIESRLYGKIGPTECLNKAWQKKLAPGEPDPAANVKALILYLNQLTNWVAQMILTQQDVKRRVIVIKHFVNVADKCRLLNNFSTPNMIMSALETAPIYRLNRTWSAVNAQSMATLENMRKVIGNRKGFAVYRDTLRKANPPCIPFFGVYLANLTYIEDGIPSFIKKTNLVNFAKRAKTAEVIRDIQQYQNVPYLLQPVPELQDYILTNMQSAGDVHNMYDTSLQIERVSVKTRRLQGTGGPYMQIAHVTDANGLPQTSFRV
ncbi:cell division control protein [Zopfia rhizophila CBS 207.26]|uniref:Cell division control protein n=1 Tax=Zopfia rhizophila CBS 207.26 TaxID=1314779 RepID=A0A6A6ENC6_9PEZI|nr:cell division control protein [Zopfia rhizophila CBS 207.26]